ncbi:hypothetical protein CK203_026882 [Vitis vinifera]|uniref:Endonuclease/exonuclease/phosphatase domain-containing protein n=1 Tax=Vitis vinifera TaxID=29760 RepID=A0A438INU5_VITVI|nr:hypothetical protein CK203_026882 [Vitis vinifera]
MTEGLVRSLGIGRFLDWGYPGCPWFCGRLRNVEDGLVWMFTGVYEPFSREDRECMWEEIGAIRGIWDDPWCLGGDFNVILSQRERRGVLTWSGGRNNQAWARLDRFLVTQNWLDHFNGVVQSRLPRTTSDHFPILLMGGGLRRGPSSFRFENMWLKVDGLRTFFRVGARGLRLEANKNSALQQVEFWDGVESERSLSEGETELKKEAKESFKKWEVREGIVNAFQHLLSEEPGWRADIEGLHLNRLNSREAEVLKLPFTEEEIYSVLMEMNDDKASGPNGFIVAFWQSSWEFVKEEIVDLFKEFYDQRSFAKSLNTTFLVLIPKKGGAEDLGDFRPISLLGGCTSFWLRCWRIVMVNGVPVGFFSNSKGLRQEDPLSPYLFVLGMEVLSNLIRWAVDGGFLSAREEQLSALSWILTWFEASSGLRINLDKSVLILVGGVEEIEEMAVELGCKVGFLPTVYLGLPLGAHHKAILYGMGWKRE